MKKPEPLTLTPAIRKALDEFTEAAKDWGWKEDQGVGAEVDKSEDEFYRTKLVLEKAIELQLRQLRRFKAQQPKNKPNT